MSSEGKPDSGTGTAYRVRLEPSGHTFEVAAGARILAGGLSAGFSMPYSCQMGHCGTCRGKVLAGKVDFGGAHPAYLPDEQRAAGLALLCQAKPLTDVVIEVHELPLLVKPRVLPALVKEVTRPAPDVAIVRIRLPLNDFVWFAAGQYVDVLLAEGGRRSYSIANPPEPEGVIDLVFHVRHSPGGVFTDYVFQRIKERDRWTVEVPLGTFFLREESDKPAIFVAGGTGYGPLRSIVLNALRRGVRRPMVLYWGARRRADLYMLDEPRQWAEKHEHFSFVPVLSEASAQDRWSGRTGFVHRAVMADFPDLSGHQVYACGTPAMVDAARREFREQCGLPEDEFFADSFLTRLELAA
jgi:CDP-4-dehydro-6-deoxyglucose reductase, E3